MKSAAARHREEIGDVLAVYRDGSSPLLVFILGGMWLLFTAVMALGSDESLVLVVVSSLIFGLVAVLIHHYTTSEVFVIAERGLLIGSVALGLRPHVIRYEQIVPGSVVPVVGARYYSHAIKAGVLPRITVRRNFWTSQGVHFVGPYQRDVIEGKPWALAASDASDSRTIWFASTGSTSPNVATEQIAAAALRAGHAELARATQAAQIIDTAHGVNPQLPGME